MGRTIELATDSAEETKAVGRAVAPLLGSGDVVSLTGDLGAGSLSNANGLMAGPGLPGVVPAYPFIVSSAYPGTPKAQQEQGAYRIHAQSEEHRSASEARTGLAAVTGLVGFQAFRNRPG